MSNNQTIYDYIARKRYEQIMVFVIAHKIAGTGAPLRPSAGKEEGSLCSQLSVLNMLVFKIRAGVAGRIEEVNMVMIVRIKLKAPGAKG
ncbi:MAG TPA: hypothetical protein GX404_09790 [Syntrophomonadaceae bacterium]|nr:hypothetical protein [Syntrophomonadaceae bacterium]